MNKPYVTQDKKTGSPVLVVPAAQKEQALSAARLLFGCDAVATATPPADVTIHPAQWQAANRAHLAAILDDLYAVAFAGALEIILPLPTQSALFTVQPLAPIEIS